ncbi:MAG: AAA family ATPase [Desulfopila sp.]
MRIDRLDLMAYGPFTNLSLDLSAGDCGLHLIYGDNEAGKSTSLRALTAWLFGIPARTNDNFLHTNAQLRIGGKLRLSDGNHLEFVRRKGAKKTLLQYDTDEPLDAALLSRFLPGDMDEALFTKLWGINHAGLTAGGQELLDQSGDLGQALFSAAVGTANLRKVLADLQNRAGEIFRPRGSKAALNQAIIHFKDAQKKMRDASLPVAEWKKLQKERAETTAAIERIEKEIEHKNRAKSRLQRVKRVQGALVQRHNLLQKIENLAHISVLPENFEESRKTAHDNLQSAHVHKERLQTKMANLNKEAETLRVRHELLENEDVILALYREQGAVEKTLKDRPRQDGKRRLLRNEAESLLKSVRPDMELDQTDTLRPLLKNKKWLTGLSKKHSLLIQEQESTEKTRRDIEDELQALCKDLDDMPQTELDIKELQAAVDTARRAGDVEQRLAEVRKRAYEEDAACTGELARLGRFTGTLDNLLELALPMSETLDAFEKEDDQLCENLKEIQRKLHEAKEEKSETIQMLKALLQKGDVPTVTEMEEARRIRDTGWSLIKRHYINLDDIDDIESELLQYALDSDVPTAYENNVHHADHLSDRLRLAADQVVKRIDYEAHIESLQLRITSLEDTLEQLNQQHNLYRQKWTSIWQPLAITAGKPREMKQWLVKVENLVEKFQAAKILFKDADHLKRQWHRLKKELSDQIVQFDASYNHEQAKLETLIAMCEKRAEEEEKLHAQRRQFEQSTKHAEIRLKRTEEELKAFETKLSSWIREWSQAIQGLGLQPDAHPEHAVEAFDQLVSFFEKFDKSEELRKRIYGIDQVEKTFAQRVFDFADAIGFEKEGQEAATITAQLHRELNTAREARTNLANIQVQLKEIDHELKDAEITIRTSQEQLASLRAQAEVATDDELIPAGENSRQKREMQKQLETLEQELNRNGDGLSIKELEKEAEESEVDALDGELEQISIELTELQGRRDILRDQRQTVHNHIMAKDGSAPAANASEEAEQYLAEITSNAEQYLRLQIAALILEQRIENYRKANQAPVLARAGELFATLTLGSYAGLRDELDNAGKPILRGVRPDDREVAVDGMSDGSRDQLYLALRLATLEQHLRMGEPTPFVVDDILIGFDDNRTRVCLEVLANLAATTQVLLFTHHRRVLELAEAIEAKAGVYTHALT